MASNLENDTTTPESIAADRSDNITGIFYISNADDQTQVFNISSAEETNNADDDAYVIPIKVILHAEHVHQSPSDNETFLKFDYILMSTNDTSYHGHFESDEQAERLTLLNSENGQFNFTNDQDDLSTTSSIAPIDVLVDENGEQYEQLNERTILNDDGVMVSRFNEIAWKRQNYQETNVQSSVAKNLELTGDRAMSSESDQENDRHYSQILPWIHFNL